MSNKPVAWMCKYIQFDGEDGDVITDKFLKSGKGGDCSDYKIPLYTHPSEHDLEIAEAIGFDKGYKAATEKTLTDGEIVKIFQKENLWQYSDLVHETDAIEFASALLKKASDK
jgi:hypothetical protein